MKVCPICGSKFDGEEVFCPHDGTRLEEMTPAADLVGTAPSGAPFKLEGLMFVDDLAARYTSHLGQVPLRVSLLNQRLRAPEKRFQSLSATAALLGSPLPEALTTLYVWDAAATPPYIVESGVKGPTLRHHLREHGPLQVSTAIKVTCALARALGWLFEHGVIHRALSSNAIHLVDLNQGRIQLAEWSLGLLGYHAHPKQALAQGKFLVTPEYSAPELIEDAEKAGEKSSIYTLGLLLYEMLTGEVYFDAPTAEEIVALQLGDARPSLSSAYKGDDLPEDLDELFSLLVNKSTQARFQSLHAVVNALCAQLPSLDPSQFPKIERAPSHPNPFTSPDPTDTQPDSPKSPQTQPQTPVEVQDDEEEEEEHASRVTQLFVKTPDQSGQDPELSEPNTAPEGGEGEDGGGGDEEEEEDLYTSTKTLRMNAVQPIAVEKSSGRKKKKKKKKKKVSGASASLTQTSAPKVSASEGDSPSILLDPSLLDQPAPTAKTTRSISGGSATLDANAKASPPREANVVVKAHNPEIDRTEKLPEVEKQIRDLEKKKARESAEKSRPVAKNGAFPALAKDDADLWFASSSENTWDQEVLREHTARTDKKVRSTMFALLILFGLAVIFFLVYILFLRPPDDPDEDASLMFQDPSTAVSVHV